MKLIRLTTGEEIIASITKETETSVTVEDSIILLPAGEGKLGMASFIPYSDGSPIEISKACIMFMTNPNDDLRRQVLRITTGLEVPTSGLTLA
jgi:hypothetical protein